MFISVYIRMIPLPTISSGIVLLTQIGKNDRYLPTTKHNETKIVTMFIRLYCFILCCMSSLISVVIIPDSNVGWTNVGPTSGRQYRRRASVGLTYTAVSLWGVPIGQMWIPLIKNKWCGCWRLSLLLGETSYQTEDLRTIWDVQMTSL